MGGRDLRDPGRGDIRLCNCQAADAEQHDVRGRTGGGNKALVTKERQFEEKRRRGRGGVEEEAWSDSMKIITSTICLSEKFIFVLFFEIYTIVPLARLQVDKRYSTLRLFQDQVITTM